ncbi:MAG: hypothetical protein Q9217_003556 [Psora testacea]
MASVHALWNAAREEQHSSERKLNMFKMHSQLEALWANVEVHVRKHGYKREWASKSELVNNNTWLNKLPAMELLRVLAPGVRLGAMLGRD